jgi:hypothetical protein
MRSQNRNFSVRGQVRLLMNRQTHMSEGMMSSFEKQRTRGEWDNEGRGRESAIQRVTRSGKGAGGHCLIRRSSRTMETDGSCYYLLKCKTRLCNKEKSAFSSDGQKRVHFQTDIDFFGETNIDYSHHFRQIQEHRQGKSASAGSDIHG